MSTNNLKTKMFSTITYFAIVLSIFVFCIIKQNINCDPYYALMILYPEANITRSEDGTQATADYWEDGYHYYVTVIDGQSGDHTVVYDKNGNIVISGTQSSCSSYILSLDSNRSAAVNKEETIDNSSSTDTATESSNKTSKSSQAKNKLEYSDEEIEAAWEETNRVESTCTEAGYIEYTNSLTNETKIEELELANHSYEEIERIESTCTEDGSVTYTCSVCGDTYTEEIPALSHDYEWVTTKEASFFTLGEEQYVCKNCGDVSKTREISATCPIPLMGIIIGICVVLIGAVSGIVVLKKKRTIKEI